MKLSEFKNQLNTLNEVKFELPNKQLVPAHFHITEVGSIKKDFIDCGGTIRKESLVSFQLWKSEDYDHRLSPEKLFSIIALSEMKLNISDDEVEVEYQAETIGKYNVGFSDGIFQLQNKYTDCLAKDDCGISETKTKVELPSLQEDSSCCDPSSGCC